MDVCVCGGGGAEGGGTSNVLLIAAVQASGAQVTLSLRGG
jgi:hypothetical protein